MQHVSWDRSRQNALEKEEQRFRQKMKDVPNSVIIDLIDEWIHSERDRKILKRRLIDGVCFEPLAEEFDLSVRRVKTIVYKSEKILYRHLKL